MNWTKTSTFMYICTDIWYLYQYCQYHICRAWAFMQWIDLSQVAFLKYLRRKFKPLPICTDVSRFSARTVRKQIAREVPWLVGFIIRKGTNFWLNKWKIQLLLKKSKTKNRKLYISIYSKFYKGTRVHLSVGLSILAEIFCHKCRNMSASWETHRTHTSTCKDQIL